MSREEAGARYEFPTFVGHAYQPGDAPGSTSVTLLRVEYPEYVLDAILGATNQEPGPYPNVGRRRQLRGPTEPADAEVPSARGNHAARALSLSHLPPGGARHRFGDQTQLRDDAVLAADGEADAF